MTTTTHLGITLVDQSQSQKEVTVNEALTLIDALLNTGAKSMSVSTPPGSPASGDLYIVGASPTGAWAGQAGQLAYFDQVWRFIPPLEGMTLWVNDIDLIYSYNGTNWVLAASNTSINVQTGTSYTLAASDSGKTVELNNASAITLTLPNSLRNFFCRIVQTGAGQVTLTAASGATLHNRSGFTKTAGQWAVLDLYVTSNSSGTAAVYIMRGDGA